MDMKLLYISTEHCNVCKSLKPKVIELISEYPDIKFEYYSLDQNPELAGEHSVFAVPTILFFVDDKEYFRESRFVSIESVKNKIDRIIELSK